MAANIAVPRFRFPMHPARVCAIATEPQGYFPTDEFRWCRSVRQRQNENVRRGIGVIPTPLLTGMNTSPSRSCLRTTLLFMSSLPSIDR